MLFEEIETSVESFEVKDNGVIEIQLSNELGYFIIDVPTDLNDYIGLIGLTVKKLNKAKAMLETLQ